MIYVILKLTYIFFIDYIPIYIQSEMKLSHYFQEGNLSMSELNSWNFMLAIHYHWLITYLPRSMTFYVCNLLSSRSAVFITFMVLLQLCTNP